MGRSHCAPSQSLRPGGTRPAPVSRRSGLRPRRAAEHLTPPHNLAAALTHEGYCSARLRPFILEGLTGNPLVAAFPLRASFDFLVQSSLVGLFAAYGISVAPLRGLTGTSQPEPQDISVAMPFQCSSRASPGRLTLSMPRQLLDVMKSAETKYVKLDWARELANQLGGRIKNRLLPFGVRLDIGTASMMDSRQVRVEIASQAVESVYPAMTGSGPLLVTLEGLLTDLDATNIGSPSPTEGSTIFF